MALSPRQYAEIKKKYDERSSKNSYLLEQRKAEIFSKLPEYKEVNDEIISTCMRYARQLISNGQTQQASQIMKLKNGMQPENAVVPNAGHENTDHENTGSDNAGHDNTGHDDVSAASSTLLKSMSSEIFDLHQKKNRILEAAGYPHDYLEMQYECSLCKDTGYIDNEKCTCFKKMEVQYSYEESHINEFLQLNNFSNLSYDYYQGDSLEAFLTALTICKNFIKNFNSDYRNLLFYGTVGTGKSFLSGCVAKELLDKGSSVVYYSAIQLFQTLSVYLYDKDKSNYQDFYDRLTRSDLLIIDDLGSEMTNEFTRAQLFSILNDRILCEKSVIISTNLSLDQLRERYSDRIVSRIAEKYELMHMLGRDIRMQKMQENNRNSDNNNYNNN